MLILLPPSRLKYRTDTADIPFSQQTLNSSAGEIVHMCNECLDSVVRSRIESRLIAGDHKLRLWCTIESQNSCVR